MKEETITSSELEKFANSDEFKLIVQKNHEKYRNKWLAWAQKNESISLLTKPSWNWFAFLFQDFWLLYRKMYVEFSLFMGFRLIIIALSVFISFLNTPLFDTALNTVLPILIGTFGNSWYLKRCIKLAKVANQQFGNTTTENGSDDAQQLKRDNFLRSTGGASLKIPAGAMVVFAIVAALIGSLAGSGSSVNIELVKGSVLKIDETVYLSDALETHPYFKNTTWEEITTPQGRVLVRFTANYNFEKEVEHMKNLGLQDADMYVEGFTDVEFVLDFLIHADKSNFDIYEAHYMVDDISQFSGQSDFGMVLIQNIYSLQPFLFSLLSGG